jgi:hypothetical protein
MINSYERGFMADIADRRKGHGDKKGAIHPLRNKMRVIGTFFKNKNYFFTN